MKVVAAALWSALLVACCSAEAANLSDQTGTSLRGSRRQLLSDQVTGFALVNSDTDVVVANLFDGAVIGLSSLGMETPTFNVKAVVSQTAGDIESVAFDYFGANFRTENYAPYAFCGKIPFLCLTPFLGLVKGFT